MDVRVYACVIVLVLLIVAASARANDRYLNYLGGYWVVHPDFAETAKLNEFQFFIGPQSKAAREGYLMVVASDGSPVANAAVEVKACLRMGSALWASLQCVDECRGSLTLDAPDGSIDAIPASLDFALSIIGGTLTLYDGENIHACLVKDIAASETALRVYDAAV